MKYIHPQDVISLLYLTSDGTLLFRDNRKVPDAQRKCPVPNFNGYYFVNVSGSECNYLTLSGFAPLLRLTCTEAHPISTSPENLPSLWKTWYLMGEDGGYVLGNNYVFNMEDKRSKATPVEVGKARNLAICNHYYGYRKDGLSSADAQTQTALLFGCAERAVRKAWAFKPAGMGKVEKSGVRSMAQADEVLSPRDTRVLQTKRTREYKVYSKAVHRALSRVLMLKRKNKDPLMYNPSFGVNDLLVNGQLRVWCPVLGVAINYTGADTRAFDAVSVWRKDTTKGFTVENMTVMSRLASMMIEGVRMEQNSVSTYLCATKNGPSLWREWNATHTTNWETNKA